jgi:diguanylate cyclase (GGDEF)-like protein
VKNPKVEALVLYLLCGLLLAANEGSLRSLRQNSNQVPFHFGLIRGAAKMVWQAVSLRVEEATDQAAHRPKGEKFGILDSPRLLARDLQAGFGPLGGACLYVDIDNFKAVNTGYSERVVDRDLLPPFQRLIASYTQSLGHAYHEGGDELLILLPNMSAAMAKEFAGALLGAVAEHEFQIENTPIRLNISVGLAHSPDSKTSGLPERANRAMRAAKLAGKGRVEVG